MIKKKEKYIFIICGKDFFKAKPERNAIAYRYQTHLMQVLQSLHGQLSGFQYLFFGLKVSRIRNKKSYLSSHKRQCFSPILYSFKIVCSECIIIPYIGVQTFVEFDDDLTMRNDYCSKHLNLAYVFLSLHFRLIDFFNYVVSVNFCYFSQYR